MARITEQRLNELNCSTITDREIRKLVKAYRKRGGWVEWGGGEFPKGLSDDSKVDVRFRNGAEFEGLRARYWWDTGLGINHWHHTQDGGDIIAYRVVK